MLVMRSLLKNGRGKAIRFSTLDGICEALECQSGDVLEWVESRSPVFEWCVVGLGCIA